MTSDKMISFDILYQKIKTDFLNVVTELHQNDLISLTKDDFKLYKDSDEYTNDEIANEFDPERSKVTRILVKNWGGSLSQNKNIDAYDQTISMSAFWPEAIRDDIVNIFNRFISEQAGKVYSLTDNDEKFICLVQCPDLPDYSDPVEAEGDYKSYCSFMMTINLIKGLTLSNDQELYIDDVLVPFSEMTVNRSFEQKANLKNNQDENSFTNTKSTFNISIDGLSTENEFTNKLWNSLYDPSHLNDEYIIKLGQIPEHDDENPEDTDDKINVTLNTQVHENGIFEYSVELDKLPSSGYGVLDCDVYINNVFITRHTVDVTEVYKAGILDVSDSLELEDNIRIESAFTYSHNSETSSTYASASNTYKGKDFYKPIITGSIDVYGVLRVNIKSDNLPSTRVYNVMIEVIDSDDNAVKYTDNIESTTSNLDITRYLSIYGATALNCLPAAGQYYARVTITAKHFGEDYMYSYTSPVSEELFGIDIKPNMSFSSDGRFSANIVANRFPLYTNTILKDGIEFEYKLYCRKIGEGSGYENGTLVSSGKSYMPGLTYIFENDYSSKMSQKDGTYLWWVALVFDFRENHPSLDKELYITRRSSVITYNPTTSYSLRSVAPQVDTSKTAGPYKMVPSNITIKYVQDSVVNYSVDFIMSM